MKGITKEQIEKDREALSEMFGRYTNAVWENQEGQKAHYDNQPKLVRLHMEAARHAIFTAKMALDTLNNIKEFIIE
ncbi:MAG: hypothetical protein J6Y37_11490 [Paludibacteraceae bacterium]|nr:hypothetical protein [Paludibacteraceae bacterium]